MAAPTKKRALNVELTNINGEDSSDFDDDDMVDEGEDAEEEDDMVGQEVQVDFEARTPEDSDFHGVRKLLQQLFLKSNINITDMTNTILGQNYVGSVLKQVTVDEEDDGDDDDGEEVFGVITVINITDKKDQQFVQQLRSMLLDRCTRPNVQAKLSDVFNAKGNLGLIINERFINMPAKISVPSFESLWAEVDKAKGRNMPYDFDQFLMVCKTYRIPENIKDPMNEPPMFINDEEQFFYQECNLCYNYRVGDEKDNPGGGTWDDEDDDLEPTRTVMVFSADKLPIIMPRLRSVFDM